MHVKTAKGISTINQFLL